MNKFSKWPFFDKSQIQAAKNVLRSGNVNFWTGSECKNFEDEFAKYFNVKYAISLSNGTLALEIALKALGIGKNDEVIVSSRSFFASASCIVNVGAKPIFSDIDLNSGNISPSNIEKNITKNTKAIICVHLAGWPCDMTEVIDIADKYNLFIIEDCAQSHGGIYKGKPLGSFGHISCWSFCQDKIMTTAGEGGMIATNDKKLMLKIFSLKDHGKNFLKINNKPNHRFKWLHDSFGTNARMTELQASVGRIQLRMLKKWVELRNRNSNILKKELKNIDALFIPEFKCASCTKQCKDKKSNIKLCLHANYKFYGYIRKTFLKKNWSRDRIIDELNSKHIPCFQGSCSEIYREKAFSKFIKFERLPNAKAMAESSIMFLVHPTLKIEEMKKMSKMIKHVFKMAMKK
jgi:dTDP-4-amino-4,6-dideoxygalactose transaminase